MSKIEWTEQTWNPIVGCSLVSPGCTNCYAMAMAARIESMPNKPRHYVGLTRHVNGRKVWTGKVALAPVGTLFAPLRRQKPTTYFVNSMGDLFHEDVPDAWIDCVFAVMALAPQHTFQVLTKRASRMQKYLAAEISVLVERVSDASMQMCENSEEAFELVANASWPLPNVWLGVSTERQQEFDERRPLLLATPAAVRFISAEPLLDRIDLTFVEPSTLGLDWVIAGGESGAGARPMHPDWVRGLRDQCQAAGVPFFFKQWGQFILGSHTSQTFGKPSVRIDGEILWSVGKRAAGRLLDGVEHNAMPGTL